MNEIRYLIFGMETVINFDTRYDTLRGLLPFLIPAPLWSGPQALGVFEDHSSRVFKSAQFFSDFRVFASARTRRRR
jgi:hypothetical protein